MNMLYHQCKKFSPDDDRKSKLVENNKKKK